MERESAAPEDLPPLELRKLRDLEVEEPSGPGRLQRVLEGELPDAHEERSKEKPDLEALTLLPPFEGNPYGALLGLGSGSGPRRDRGFVCALAPDGSLADEPREISLAPVYSLLRQHVA